MSNIPELKRRSGKYRGIEVIGSIEAKGKQIFEDASGISYCEGSGWPIIGIFDGRRAWHESGDSQKLVADFQTESTGQLAATSAKSIVADFVSVGGPSYGLSEANKLWKEALEKYGYNLARPEGLPGCATSIFTVDTEKRWLDFAHLCDTKIICFDKKGNYFIPTVDQMDLWDRRVFWQTLDNAKKLGVSPRVALWEIDYRKHPKLVDPKTLDHEHRTLENVSVEAGIGVLNGMSSMTDFMQTGSFPIGGFEYILTCTDGLSFPCGIDDQIPWQEMINFLLKHELSLEALVEEIRAREDSDMEFIKFPRFSYHRDATGILIKV